MFELLEANVKAKTEAAAAGDDDALSGADQLGDFESLSVFHMHSEEPGDVGAHMDDCAVAVHHHEPVSADCAVIECVNSGT